MLRAGTQPLLAPARLACARAEGMGDASVPRRYTLQQGTDVLDMSVLSSDADAGGGSGGGADEQPRLVKPRERLTRICAAGAPAAAPRPRRPSDRGRAAPVFALSVRPAAPGALAALCELTQPGSAPWRRFKLSKSFSHHRVCSAGLDGIVSQKFDVVPTQAPLRQGQVRI